MSEKRGVISMTSKIEAVLDALFQPPPDWPTIRDLNLAELFDAELSEVGAMTGTNDLLALLPEAFVGQSREEREGALKKIEEENPLGFATMLAHASNVYYSAPGVLQKLEQAHGYPARPPLYVGYELSAFDEALLEPQKKVAETLFRESNSFGALSLQMRAQMRLGQKKGAAGPLLATLVRYLSA